MVKETITFSQQMNSFFQVFYLNFLEDKEPTQY